MRNPSPRLDKFRQIAGSGLLRRVGLLCLIVALGFLGLRASQTNVAVITLDPSVRYQTMRGWEATADLPDDVQNWPLASIHPEILERAVEEVGINRVRLEIRSGAETASTRISDQIAGRSSFEDWKPTRYLSENDNDDPQVINWDGFDFAELDWHVETYVLPMKRLLEERGEALFVNLCYVSFFDGRHLHRDPEEYAELVEATYRHLTDKYGLVPDSWEIILEPDLPRDGWTGTDIGKAIVASARRLEALGIEPAFVVPSVTDMSNTLPYLDEIAAVPGALDHVVEISYHRYRGRDTRTLAEIADRAQQLGIATSMLEWWFGKATHEVLHEDLTVGNAASWQGRVINGLFAYPPDDASRFRMQPEVRYNAQYFRHVRFGAVRIAAQSSRPGTFVPTAFINPDGGHTVVVGADTGGGLTIRGLPSGSYRVSYTVPDEHVEIPEPVSVGADGVLETAIPDPGVLTIRAAR